MRIYFALVASLLLLAGCVDSEERIVRKAEKIHASVLTVDTHVDTPILMRRGLDIGERNDAGQVDIPRMIEGGLDAAWFVVYLGQGSRDEESTERAYRTAHEIFDMLHESVEANSDKIGLALTPEDAYRLRDEGKRAMFIGVENGYPIGTDINRLEEFYNRGMRYLGLVHNGNNEIADAATDRSGPEHGGLSDFGREVIAELNRLGVMIDLSHSSDDTFYEVLEVTKAPVVLSHTSVRALREHPRNIDDQMLLALKDNGGVIQICLLSGFLISPEPNPELDERIAGIREKYSQIAGQGELTEEQRSEMNNEIRAARSELRKVASVKDAVDHIDHVVQLIGVDYVGIGSDFDGGGGIEGVRSVADMQNITIELVRRGYSKSDIEKIWGGNFNRVFSEVIEIGKSLQ